MPVSRRTFDALQSRYRRMVAGRDAAVALAEERLCTIVRLCAEVDQLRDRQPDAPLPYAQASSGDAEVRRQLHLARRAMAALDERLTGLQTVNEAQALELRAYADKDREVSAS